MRKAYISREPEKKGIVIPIEDVALYNDEKEYVCYSSKVPKFAPKNFTLVLPKLTPTLRKKLMENGYRIFEDRFDLKRIFADQNRMAVYKDIEKLENVHICAIIKNMDKFNSTEREILTSMGELIYSVNGELLKGATVFGIAPKEIRVRY